MREMLQIALDAALERERLEERKVAAAETVQVSDPAESVRTTSAQSAISSRKLRTSDDDRQNRALEAERDKRLEMAAETATRLDVDLSTYTASVVQAHEVRAPPEIYSWFAPCG